jgi:hypothetical protein
MRAEKAIRALLLAAPGVVTLVADRVYPGQAPQGVAFPVLVVSHVSTVETPTIDAAAEFGLVLSRIQVAVLAKDYPAQKALLEEVRKACNHYRGTVAGVRVVSVMRDLVGPDQRDDDMQVYLQTVDFRVTHFEP